MPYDGPNKINKPILMIGNQGAKTGRIPSPNPIKSQTVIPTPENVLPCPFCGRPPIFKETARENGKTMWAVRCNNTDCTLYQIGTLFKYTSLEEILEKWNKQPYATRLNEDLQSHDDRYDFHIYRLQDVLTHITVLYSEFLQQNSLLPEFHHWVDNLREKGPEFNEAIMIFDKVLKEEVQAYEDSTRT